jgi:transposase InsO family protein
VKFAAIEAEKAKFPIVTMCRLLRVSTSGFYAWARRGECKRDIENRALTVQIAALHAESKGRYGYPRIHAAPRNRGSKVGRNRVARLMRERDLRGRRPRAYRQTTASNPAHEKIGNVLNRNFTPTGANESWASDITYIATREGWLYLAIVMDLYSRRIVALEHQQQPPHGSRSVRLGQRPGQSAGTRSASLRQRLPVHQLCLSAPARPLQSHPKHESQRQLLGQRSRREHLLQHQARTP